MSTRQSKLNPAIQIFIAGKDFELLYINYSTLSALPKKYLRRFFFWRQALTCECSAEVAKHNFYSFLNTRFFSSVALEEHQQFQRKTSNLDQHVCQVRSQERQEISSITIKLTNIFLMLIFSIKMHQISGQRNQICSLTLKYP